MRGKFIIIYVTCPSEAEARKIADRLLREKFIACANILNGVRSLFWWKGRINRARESLLVMKTAKGNFRKVRNVIKKLHSYEVPEIIAVPIEACDGDYLRWIRESVTA